jgi:hypothetical protein
MLSENRSVFERCSLLLPQVSLGYLKTEKPIATSLDAGYAAASWVLRRRDPARGTEPQMSLKQFPSDTKSGTESFYSFSASLVHRLSNLSADLLRGSPFREFHVGL